MNRQQFTELVKDPRTLGEGTIAELQDLLREYPYCQTAQILLTYNLFRQNNPAYQAQLKKAVAYAGDRKKLKELLEVKKEQPLAVSHLVSAEAQAEPDQQVIGNMPMPIVSGLEPALPATAEPSPAVPVPEPSPAIPVSLTEPVILPGTSIPPLQASAEEPHQENYIEDSVISSEELALASPQAPTPEVAAEGPVLPQSPVGKPFHTSLEKMTQDELLAIVRKRLAEINNENKGTELKQEKSIQPGDEGNGAPVLRKVAEPGRSKDELIEKFIREEPQISRPKREFFNPTASSQKSNLDEEDIVSETLALLYAKQGNLQKAIHIYEKLSLRFSEKSRYFAARIENLKGNTSQSS